MNTVEGWGKKRLDEFGTIFSGSTPSTSIRSFWNGEIVWVTPNDLSKLKTPYLIDSSRRITEKGLQGCSAQLLPPGSLVISSRAPIGYVALPVVQFCTNQGCKTIKFKSELCPEYMYYNVLFNIDKVKKLGEGTTFAEISKTALSNVEFSYPIYKPEQAKIAEILLTLDQAIEQTEALIAKQQRNKIGLMQALLTFGIDEQGNIRSEETHRFKDSPLGRIPIDWEVVELSSVTPSADSITYGVLKPGIFFEGGIPLLQIEDVIHGNINVSSLHKISAELDNRYKRTRLQGGELVVSLVGTIGRVAYIPYFLRGANIHRNLGLVRIVEPNSSRFMFHYLQSDIGQKEFSNSALGSTQALLNLSSLRALRIKKPTPMEQVLIAEKCDYIALAISKYAQSLQKLRLLRTALMQDLLTGRKRVTPLLNETEVING